MLLIILAVKKEIKGALQIYAKDGTLEVPLVKKFKVAHDTFLLTFELFDHTSCLGLEIGQHISVQ